MSAIEWCCQLCISQARLIRELCCSGRASYCVSMLQKSFWKTVLDNDDLLLRVLGAKVVEHVYIKLVYCRTLPSGFSGYIITFTPLLILPPFESVFYTAGKVDLFTSWFCWS